MFLVNNGYSLSRIRAEIDKCDVRCRNCGARVTYERDPRDWRTRMHAITMADRDRRAVERAERPGLGSSMTFQDRHAAARQLNEWLTTANEHWGKSPVFDQNAGLLGQLVSRIAVATGGHEINHIATDVSDASVRATIFIDGAVIDASFKEGAIVVDVLPLAIRSLRITATQDLLADERVDPEQPLAVNVTLDEGRTLTLRGSGTDDDDLMLFLPRLLDLTAAR